MQTRSLLDGPGKAERSAAPQLAKQGGICQTIVSLSECTYKSALQRKPCPEHMDWGLGAPVLRAASLAFSQKSP